MSESEYQPRLLMLATMSCAYPGADAVGKARIEYYPRVHVVGMPAPVMFPMDFFMRTYAKGIDGIIIAACGSDCPYEGAYSSLSKRIDEVVQIMKAGEIEIERIRLTAICTVCIKAFVKEIEDMKNKLSPMGPVDRAKSEALWKESLARRDERAKEFAAKQVA
jgi:coenzyme F420-reducing hydrogenase delta subunit